MEWKPEELRRIAETDDLHVSPFREDGVTYGTPTWIWSVVVDDGLYVRGYNGQQSRWYQAATRQKAGRIRAAGMTKEVRFESVDGAMNNRIDDGYRAKYADSPYLKPICLAECSVVEIRFTERVVEGEYRVKLGHGNRSASSRGEAHNCVRGCL